MARESFADEPTAADLARSFVSVKVDREERPDIDTVYMTAALVFAGSGGWPLSAFCTPDGRPFFVGTYFPPTDRHGLPSFRRVLAALSSAWVEHRDEVEEQADLLARALAREVGTPQDVVPADRRRSPTGDRGRGSPDAGAADAIRVAPETARRLDFDAVLDEVVADLADRFDERWGGFGDAPKFPAPGLVELCLRHDRRRGDHRSRVMALRTLDAMAAGGIYDHLAGGFARYATDGPWLVPHFEKMLTDQALLARAYLHAWQESGRDEYLQVVQETLGYVLRELSSPEGGLCSSQGADAAGVEGGHATFTMGQLRDALGQAGRPDLVEPAAAWYGVTERGDWEGTNVLHRPVGAPLTRPPVVEEIRSVLLAARLRRPQPDLDDKVLTEWNAMAAAVMAEAATASGDARWSRASVAVGEFLFSALRRDDGRWLRSWQGGHARHLAMASDYGWLLECCCRLAELTGAARWLERAREVADQLLELFTEDGRGGGGLYSTGADAETLIVRPKEFIDGALPSPNSVGARALARLAALSGEDRYRQAAETIVDAATPLLTARPVAVADLVPTLSLLRDGSELVVTGDRPDLLDESRRTWFPNLVVAWGERTESPLWQDREDGAAYLCQGFACRMPATDRGTLAAQLAPLGRD